MVLIYQIQAKIIKECSSLIALKTQKAAANRANK